MSAIRVRPHLLEHDEQFARIVNTYYTRHFVKPGITGLAQSQGYRGEIANQSLLEKRIGYDMLYIGMVLLARLADSRADGLAGIFPPQSAY